MSLAPAPGLPAWLAALRPAALLHRIRRAIARAEQAQSLRGLDGRMLRDIGLTPAEAERLANASIWRD